MNGYSEQSFQLAWSKAAIRLTGLRSDMGQSVDLVDVGRLNRHSGPDFLDARVLIDGNLLSGAIELHRNPGEWYQHGHHLDPSYNCVVLHVSPTAAKRAIVRSDGSRVPHVDIGRMMPSWLPATSVAANHLPCQAVIGQHADVLGEQLAYASDRYFEELTGRHLTLVRSHDDLGSETLRAMFIRACSVLGAPANREAMAEAATVVWDSNKPSGNPPVPGMNLETIAWRQNCGRPASRPAIRMKQATDILAQMRAADAPALLATGPDAVMMRVFNPFVGAATGRVIFATVVLPALWAHAMLAGQHQKASEMHSIWTGASLAASPEASLAFRSASRLIEAKRHKALTWQYRSMCAVKDCAACRVGNRMLS